MNKNSIIAFIIIITSINGYSEELVSKTQNQTSDINHIISYVDSVANELVAEDLFSGAILIAKNGQTFYKRVEGYASKEFKVPNKIDTKFNLGSMNKMFTGIAIVRLEQEGKLSFEDKVGKFLLNYPNDDVREKVTIHQLLTHTSGIGSYWKEFFDDPNWAQMKTVQDYDDLSNKNPLYFEPGKKFMYSNSGPIILGLIIEEITGMSYDEYLNQIIFEPLKMSNTYCFDISNPIPNLARGYSKITPFGEEYKNWKNNLFFNPVKGGPAGGGYSTVEDLLKFANALQNDDIIDAKHFNIMTTGKVVRNSFPGLISDKKDLIVKYAYLFEDISINGYRCIGHSGGAMGINSTLKIFTDSNITLIILSNYENGMFEVYNRIEQLLYK